MARLSAALGRPLMPWQQLVADVALEVQSEAAGDPAPGEWAYNDVTLTVQRQAGKTKLLVPVVVHRCGTGPRRRVFTTAQKREKARDRWMDLTDDILTSPLRHEVRRLTARSGEELRWKRTQSTCRPFAPNEDDMHGETPDLVLVDELHAFDHHQAKEVQGAYVPGFTTKDAQAWKYSTAGTDRSWWLNTARAAGRKAVDADTRLGTAYFEWSLPDRIGSRRLKDLSDEELVEACIAHHPAAGHTLRPAAVRLAWTQMGGDRAEFLRAYGNRSAQDLTERWLAMTEADWTETAEVDGIPQAAPFALGVWVDDDGADAAVAAGWRDQGERMHSVHLERRDGVRWVAGYVAERVERNEVRSVAIANVKAARDVADELARVLPDLDLQLVGQADVAAACVRHRTGLTDRAWGHGVRGGEGHEQRVAEAQLAASSARWRLGRWDPAGDSIGPLGGQTLAGWGWDHAPEPVRKRKFKVR